MAAALKAAAHWTALSEACNPAGPDDVTASELYARAGKVAEEAAASPAPEAAASALMVGRCRITLTNPR